MQHGYYRKLPPKICWGCDHPEWAPCKKVDPKTACRKCRKALAKSKGRKKEVYYDDDSYCR